MPSHARSAHALRRQEACCAPCSCRPWSGLVSNAAYALCSRSKISLCSVLFPVTATLRMSRVAVDPTPAVAAAAETALGAVCAACNYKGLHELVAANADYVVDGVCRQLRHLDTHSRSVLLTSLNC